MLTAAEALAQRPGLRVPDSVLNSSLARGSTLRKDQADFVRHLTQQKGAVRFGIGWAGSGKTTALKTLVDACEHAGIRVVGVAPTGQAARKLGESIGIECQTTTKFLGDYRIPLLAAIVFHLCQFWRAFCGKRTWPIHKPKPAKITPNTLVLVDESGMTGTPHMRKLLELVQLGGGTACLIGDPAQLPAVVSTAPLKALVDRYGAVQLRKIRRQKKLWARAASKAFAQGHVRRALAIYARRNRVTVLDDTDEAVRRACLMWTAEGLLTPQRAVLIANTNELVHKANTTCQEHRLAAGVLDRSVSIRIVDEQDDAVWESRVHVGDRVLFTRNSTGRKGYGVVNGSLGTVMAISPSTPEISVMLDNNTRVTVDVAKYRNILLGYTGTTWRLQGATAARVYAILAGNALNLPISYVQATRAVEDTWFFTTKDLVAPDLSNLGSSPLVRKMSRRPDLRLASDLLRDAPLDLRSRKPRIRKPSPKDSPESQQDQDNNEKSKVISSADYHRRLRQLRALKRAWAARNQQIPDPKYHVRLRRLRAQLKAWKAQNRQAAADAAVREAITRVDARLARWERKAELRRRKEEFELAKGQGELKSKDADQVSQAEAQIPPQRPTEALDAAKDPGGQERKDAALQAEAQKLRKLPTEDFDLAKSQDEQQRKDADKAPQAETEDPPIEFIEEFYWQEARKAKARGRTRTSPQLDALRDSKEEFDLAKRWAERKRRLAEEEEAYQAKPEDPLLECSEEFYLAMTQPPPTTVDADREPQSGALKALRRRKEEFDLAKSQPEQEEKDADQQPQLEQLDALRRRKEEFDLATSRSKPATTAPCQPTVTPVEHVASSSNSVTLPTPPQPPDAPKQSVPLISATTAPPVRSSAPLPNTSTSAECRPSSIPTPAIAACHLTHGGLVVSLPPQSSPTVSTPATTSSPQEPKQVPIQQPFSVPPSISTPSIVSTGSAALPAATSSWSSPPSAHSAATAASNQSHSPIPNFSSPIPSIPNLQLFDPSNGYQRMRLPMGSWAVTNNPSVLAASCVDGGISETSRRPAPPPGHPLTFSTSTIHVQRITPTRSAVMTLDEATRSGQFALVGTGCQEMLRIQCARGESWQVTVNDNLAILSAQDDLAAAEKHYHHPNVVQETRAA